MTRDWVAWHASYDDPTSALSERRRQVTTLIRKSLDEAPAGPIRVLSLCAGDARDLADALAEHRRCGDVSGAVVEVHPELAAAAQANLLRATATVEVIRGDAGAVATFRHVLPVDLLLLVGVLGNVSDADVANTIGEVPRLCREGATIVWTRHRREPDLTPMIREWFDASGCVALDFVSPGERQFAVGRERLVQRSDGESADQLFRFLN